MTVGKTKSLALCALFTALIAIGAFIRIPIPYTDYFTLQFLFVILAGMMLGPAKALTAASVYVLLGLIGLPIFASGGGLGYVFQPTFGYLLGFVAGAWLTGMALRLQKGRAFWNYLIAALCGFVTVYAIGLSYKYIMLNAYTGTPVTWAVLIMACFPLDIPGDLLSCLLGAFLAMRVNPAVGVLDGQKPAV